MRAFLRTLGVAALLIFLPAYALASELLEVTVRARGADKESALSAAVDEAIRRTLGSIFSERSQLEGDELDERFVQYSRGAATNFRILESSTDGSGVILTVAVTVDSSQIKENARVLKDGKSDGFIERRKTPQLETGQKKLSAFFRKFRYENFLDVELAQKQTVDLRKGFLNVTATLGLNRKRYASEFAAPLAKTLDEIFATPTLRAEIEEEYAKPDDRFASSFYILGENFSFRGYSFPRAFFDVFEREARFWDAKRGEIQTHERIWLHFSLLDTKGTEIERLPVHLNVSNVLFFSENRKESANPWFFMGIEETGTKNNPTLIAAPVFGSAFENSFFDRASVSFAFVLPEDVLKRVATVKVALELER
ncbi:hypothetical protein FACS1894187_22810 [Synergistales bacterium]|nr:hypothetical protein FACS1894187_22810 [Synergistales bacterium]